MAKRWLLLATMLLAGSMAAAQAGDARPVPDANGVYRIGHGVLAPVALVMPDPEYPEEMRKNKTFPHSWEVLLIVNADGTVRDARMVHSFAEGQPPKLRKVALALDEIALKTVRQYRFKPAKFEGKPVPVAMEVETSINAF
jgi:outer membrane biosynthesis protein TonB